jgi:hypothetical protein
MRGLLYIDMAYFCQIWRMKTPILISEDEAQLAQSTIRMSPIMRIFRWILIKLAVMFISYKREDTPTYTIFSYQQSSMKSEFLRGILVCGAIDERYRFDRSALELSLAEVKDRPEL